MAMAFGCWAQGRTVESYPWQPHFSGGEMQKHLCAVWCQHMLKNPRWSNLIWSPPLHCLTFSMCRYRTLNTRYHILIGGGNTKLPMQCAFYRWSTLIWTRICTEPPLYHLHTAIVAFCTEHHALCICTLPPYIQWDWIFLWQLAACVVVCVIIIHVWQCFYCYKPVYLLLFNPWI